MAPISPATTDAAEGRGHDLFPHGADVGIRGFGPTPEAAFEEAGLALTAAITDVARVSPERRVDIACEAPELELLLVEWLNALIFEMAVRNMLFACFAVTITDGRLEGKAWGEAIDPERHQPAAEAKGATLTALKVAKEANRWIAECVVDV